jgi:Fur family ferric uptake transcriptional regulator
VSGHGSAVEAQAWADAREALRDRGLRWTPQRRLILEVLAETSGHITGAELVERCRARDTATIPSTVYRTLDVLEDLGVVRHAHGLDGREEFHILPDVDHGHLWCSGCNGTWDVDAAEAADMVAVLAERRGFRVDLSHLSVSGLCRGCASD